MSEVILNHAHLFCGLGSGAAGYNDAEPRVAQLKATMRCLGGIDNNPAACADFKALTGVDATCMDLFDRDQYVAFFGHEPPEGWRQAMPDDIRRAFGYEHPHMIFLSAPCKGFSGLLPEIASRGDKYQALNSLTLRGVWLALEAYKDDPVELYIFENVPRIATRGRYLLDRIKALFQSYGYVAAETAHDCGEIGELAQSRKRFLLVARHREKVPNFLYEPPKRPLRGVGEVLERLPLPGDTSISPMHRMPELHWKTWVRLAFVEAGSDWRSLNRLRVEDGHLADFAIAPDCDWHSNVLGVSRWADPAGTITGQARATTGTFSVADPRYGEWHPGASSAKLRVTDWDQAAYTVTGSQQVASGAGAVADPRIDGHDKSVQLGVRRWGDPAPTVTTKMIAGGGPHSVADPRVDGPRFNHLFRVVRWDQHAPAVAGPGGAAGGLTVADPRPAPRDDYKQTKYRVTGFDEATGTVISASTTGNGAFAVADPRPVGLNAKRDHYQTGGHYGVVPWDEPAYAVPGYAKHDRGHWSVADPRVAAVADALPAQDDRLVAVIRALDGTWHRPFTTLELAALQSLFDPDDVREFTLDGRSDSAWRERIGNAVPRAAAREIATVMGRTLLLAMTGETFMLSSDPIWVRPITMALAVDVAAEVR